MLGHTQTFFDTKNKSLHYRIIFTRSSRFLYLDASSMNMSPETESL
jgi:hypothetical protein